jgi:Do/DeqQ family serine protease
MKISQSRKLTLLTSILFLIVSLTSTVVFSSTPINTSLAPMLQTVLPAVVNIKAQIKINDFNTLNEMLKERGKRIDENNNDMELPKILGSVASGVIVDARNGYILTNAHIVVDAQSVTITLADGHHYNAKVIGFDKPSDIALLQIKGKNLTALPMGNSNDLKVGDFVAAIGNPFGLSQTVTSGIVSALGRTTLGIETYENFIQTDAPINPGNSGGALIDMQGRLIGLNTAILAPSRGSIGIGFAIPINMAKSIMEQLIEYGNVRRGVLGIGAQDITPELANAFDITATKGAAVTQVLPNSPAELSGVKVGDIITSVNGLNVKNASDVVNTIGFLRVNSKVNINVLRQNKPITISVTLTDPKKRKEIIAQLDPFLNGVDMKDFNVVSSIHGNVEGIGVVGVDQESNAYHSGLRPLDVITSVNQQRVKNIEELKAALSKSGKQVLLNVLRGPSAIFLVISKEES